MEDEIIEKKAEPVFMGNLTEEEKASLLEASNKSAQDILAMVAKNNLGKFEEEKSDEPLPKEVLIMQQDAKVKLTTVNEKTQHFNNVLKRKQFRDRLVDVPEKIQEALKGFKYYPALKDEGSDDLNAKKTGIFECPIEKIESIHPDLVKDYMTDIVSNFPAMNDVDLEYVKYQRKADNIFVITRVLTEKEDGSVLSEEPLFYIDPKNSMFDTSDKVDPQDPFAALKNRFVEDQLEKNPTLPVVKNEYGNLDIAEKPQVIKEKGIFGKPNPEPSSVSVAAPPVLSSLLKKRPVARTAAPVAVKEEEEDEDSEEKDDTVMEIRFRGAHITIRSDRAK